MKILSILSKKSSAFSLLEVLVAISVLSVLLVILLNIVQNATSLWRGAENKVEAYRTNLTNTQNIGFLAALPISSQDTTSSKSDICAVGYFVAYDNKSPIAGDNGRQSYNLYRYFLESNETFAKLKNNPESVLDIDPNRLEILARNVISFNATYFKTDGTNFSEWNRPPATNMPDLVEIKITSVNNERTMRFKARDADAEWKDFSANTNSPDYLKNTKTFTTRIKLNTP